MSQQLTLPQLARAIEGGMGNLSMRISRWVGRTVAPSTKVEDKSGTDITDRTTRPCLTLDREPTSKKRFRPYVHDLFGEIDKNGNALAWLKATYTTPDSLDGLHLMSLSRAPEIIKKLTDLKEQRTALVNDMQAVWETDIVPAIYKHHAAYWSSIEHYIPKAAALHDHFGVIWDLRPLTPLTAADLDLSKLNAEDTAKVIESSNRMLKEQMEVRVKAVAQQVFGDLETLCDEILSGKKGVSKELLDKIILMGNFDGLANDVVMIKANRIQEILGASSSRKINGNEKLSSAVRDAISEFSQGLRGYTVDLGLNTRQDRNMILD
jgi:hypothetical protein